MKLANAPCSWGILEFELEGESPDYTQVLDEMSSIGYKGTELGDWGFMPTDPSLLRDELEIRKLSLLGAFVPVNFIDADAHTLGEETALQHARLLADTAGDTPFIVLADDNGSSEVRTQNAGRILAKHSLTTKQWDVYSKGVNRIAESILNETGLRSVFHHHCAGFIETPDEIDRLLELTDPNHVGLCFDTGHYRFGGGVPIEIFDKHADRIWHVHFKDCEPEIAARSRQKECDYFKSVGSGVFCELGKGEVDFPAFVVELQQQKYDGWIVVEQDVLPGMGSPYDSAKRNYEYLKSIGI